MRQQTQTGTGSTGLASVLMIVMILALTCFGVLALSSARADSAVSARAEAFSAGYYAAEAGLARQLAERDAEFRAGRLSLPEGAALPLTEPTDQAQALCMTVRPGPDGHLEVVSCELTYIDSWRPSEVPGELWNGGE